MNLSAPANPINTAKLLDAGWADLPASYRLPDKAATLDEARSYCRRLAESHYENFHVASWFLPKAERPHLYAIYAYCRISDDLADEVRDPAQSLALLDFWEAELDACYEGDARHPVFVALRETIHARAIPKSLFADLLAAFRQDRTVARYDSQSELLAYCRYSANPVGRLVLHAFGEADEERCLLSDATCTALQLANFWQDVRRDYAIGRIYLPQKDMLRFGVSEDTIARGVATPEFRSLLRFEIEIARDLFARGRPLVDRVRRDLAIDLDLFTRGGLEILRAIEKQNYDVFRSRPTLTKSAKFKLALSAASGKLMPWSGIGGQRSGGRLDARIRT